MSFLSALPSRVTQLWGTDERCKLLRRVRVYSARKRSSDEARKVAAMFVERKEYER